MRSASGRLLSAASERTCRCGASPDRRSGRVRTAIRYVAPRRRAEGPRSPRPFRSVPGTAGTVACASGRAPGRRSPHRGLPFAVSRSRTRAFAGARQAGTRPSRRVSPAAGMASSLVAPSVVPRVAPGASACAPRAAVVGEVAGKARPAAREAVRPSRAAADEDEVDVSRAPSRSRPMELRPGRRSRSRPPGSPRGCAVDAQDGCDARAALDGDPDQSVWRVSIRYQLVASILPQRETCGSKAAPTVASAVVPAWRWGRPGSLPRRLGCRWWGARRTPCRGQREAEYDRGKLRMRASFDRGDRRVTGAAHARLTAR